MADEEQVSTADKVEALFTKDMDTEPAQEQVEEPVEAEAEETQEVVEEELDEVDPEPVVEGDDLVEVEFEGQLIEAPKAVAEALMKNADYTKKTQTLSADRKALEVQTGEVKELAKQYEFAQEIQPDILKAQQLEQQAEQAHQYLRDNIDDLSSVDIEKIRLAVDDARSERDKLVESLKVKQTEFQQAQEQSHKELLDKGTEVLRSRIPGWGEKSQAQVREYALAAGFTEQDIASVVDPRQVEALWKAAQYDQLQAGKVAAVKKVTGTPSIKAKPREAMPEATKRKLSLRKQLKNPKMSSRDKAKAIEKDFGERFG